MNVPPQPSLFLGEVLDTVAGYPCLYKYTPCDSIDKPLVVFLPGGFHLARIAYGGHDGCQPKDFLCHWLSRAGFTTLAISYPLESGPAEIMPATCPDFRIRDWGQQAAEVTKTVIEIHRLSPKVILASWSMGGRVVVPFVRAAQVFQLRVELFVSMAATPGLAGLLGNRTSMVHCSNTGYAAAPNLAKRFYKQVQEQSALNHTTDIISETTFLHQYFGNAPVNLLGYGLRREVRDLVDDEGLAISDSQVSAFASFPWIAVLYPNSESDARHSLSDKATWGFIFSSKLVSMVEDAKKSGEYFGNRWQTIAAHIDAIPDKLSTRIEGNHYFFVGERGARETATAIASHWETYQHLRAQLTTLLGIES
ncbi:hypothetical protein R3P38DRAFT_2997911 [Favolaschia claudopus]|uniref:AB hydrolase-1 domain-containing protein n=1 Tax=Favolaschia claudopus TaxID=2862362 RepID=A0AAW0AP82_9AGAR